MHLHFIHLYLLFSVHVCIRWFIFWSFVCVIPCDVHARYWQRYLHIPDTSWTSAYSCFEKGCPTKAYATIPKGITGNGFLVLDWGFRFFSNIEGNSTNKCIYAFSFLVGEHPWPSIDERQTRSTNNTNRHCRVRLYTLVGQPLSKQLYASCLQVFWFIATCEETLGALSVRGYSVSQTFILLCSLTVSVVHFRESCSCWSGHTQSRQQLNSTTAISKHFLQ